MKTLKFVLMCIAALAMIACEPNNPNKTDNDDTENNGTENNGGENNGGNSDDEDLVFNSLVSVTDGSIEDWNKLPKEYLAVAECAEEPYWEALKSVKVYADLVYINVLVEYDLTGINLDSVAFHLYFDTDLDASTGGYADQWSDADTDVLLEGSLFQGGKPVDYVPSAHMWTGEVGGAGWYWEALAASGVFYASQWVGDNMLEIQLMRVMIPASWSREGFKVGFDIQENWESVGVLPNLSLNEEGGVEYAEKLLVTIDNNEY